MTLACRKVSDSNECGVLGSRLAARRQVGAEVDYFAARGAKLGAIVGDPRTVGDHELRLGERALDCRATLREARSGVVEVGAVDRDDERIGYPRGQHGVGGRDGIVGVDQVEGELLAKLRQCAAKRLRCPASPGAVRAAHWWRGVADVIDLDAIDR
ncbi:unannotated protein [freshwater metagenome]|uniref:Unannotated protein n=1 Tax=freshwater metagenome TaxID=449393 RepID=A0A6J5ZNU1_9ZZZZ